MAPTPALLAILPFLGLSAGPQVTANAQVYTTIRATLSATPAFPHVSPVPTTLLASLAIPP